MGLSHRTRMLLGLTVLAVFGALELAVVGVIVGFVIEIVFGIDVPLINWVSFADARILPC
jgi:hypothetical protein